MDLFAGHLAVLPIFHDLSPLQVATIARRAERVSYTPGAVIIEENGVADAAILVVAGKAVRVSGPELVGGPEPVPLGSLLGEAAMMVETTYGSTVVARTDVRTVHITRDRLLEQMLEDPSVADQLVVNLASRLHRFADVLRSVDALLGREAEAAAALPAVPAPMAAAIAAPTP